MKKPIFHLRRNHSFTLVELLVVIAIIAVLAGILLSAGGMAMRAAQRAKAFNTANQIQSACLNYYTEYSLYPVPNNAAASTDVYIDDTTSSKGLWADLLYGLCGNNNPYDPTITTPPANPTTNSRGIQFLSLKKTDVDANNAPLNPLPNATQIYFNIAIDNDYDGMLGTNAPTQGHMPNFYKSTTSAMDYTGSSTAGVAVWANCNGKSTATPTGNPNSWVHTY